MKARYFSPLLLAGAAVAVVTLPSHRTTSLPNNAIPNKFIFEVASVSEIPRDLQGRSPHEAVYDSLRKRGVGFTVDREFNHEGLFVGASVTLDNADDVKTLVSDPKIQALRPVISIPSPKDQLKKLEIVKSRSDPHVPADTESTHILTGVDKLHAKGVLGKGIKIGIIDTGTDYTHPSLGGGFGPGFKVAGGFDFVGDAYDGSNTPVPDNDPLDQCNGHGTHVAGIIGANPGNEFNISGVAYESTIFSYRLFGCSGSVSDDIIVEALLRGVSDGMNILTMSLGGADGWTESSSSVVSSRISATGRIVTIAAGNDGAFGSWYSSSPGNGINSLSVASIENTVIPLQNATVSGDVTHDPITYFATFPLPINDTRPVYATSNDTTVVDDACDPLPDSTPDLSKFIVVIRRGTCTFVQKLQNAADKGMTAALIYDNGNGFAAITVDNFTATLIQADDGAFLVEQFAAGKEVLLTFPQSGADTQFPSDVGGLVSTFTSYGPTNDMFFKPAIAAPGGNIISTFPVPLGSFAVLSGTSMATPFMAGVSALLFGVKGTSPAVGIAARDLFQTTAQKVPSSKTDGDPLQTLTQQGAGLVDAFHALNTHIIVSPGQFVLNDTANFKPLQTFTVKNTGRTSKSFKLSHVPAGTATTVTAGDIFAADGPVPLTTQYASVKFSESSFTVRPGQTQKLTAHFTAPKGVDATTFPVFSGWIQLTSADEQLQVAYMGLAASLKDKQIVDNTDEFFGLQLPAILDTAGDVQVAPTNYTFNGTDAPTLLFRLAFGTPLILVDLVPSNAKISTTLNRREELDLLPRKSSSSIKTLGNVFEFDYSPRNSDASDAADNGWSEITLTNTFANGTTIPNGSYKLLFRALKVTGSPKNEADFESWLSPVIGVAA
ncbi:subtilisin-like protease [Punctularia strigosozonata HHB-11173 SS5]|uniref:subtilisin-like protease n=1 Tax=Punctularia strigosozonata (strain HHB-11173) TaxID=741275 RepID=UPI0004416C82|nr:subtilisin-like protease [Punctularia strigosozonata HHB-11173 SS5]EIN11775.1 subtilisin-like protease [Punctularia strigosozonata HHB-11173 SS5]